MKKKYVDIEIICDRDFSLRIIESLKDWDFVAGTHLDDEGGWKRLGAELSTGMCLDGMDAIYMRYEWDDPEPATEDWLAEQMKEAGIVWGSEEDIGGFVCEWYAGGYLEGHGDEDYE